MSKQGMGRRIAKADDEIDVHCDRRTYNAHKKAGKTSAIKKRSRRRERREAKKMED